MKKWLVAIWGLLAAPFLMFRKDSSGYPACSMHDRPEVPHDLEHQQEIESVFRNAFKSSVFRAL